jgi:hypothetical protein
LMHPRHFVVATGLGGGAPMMPKIPLAVGGRLRQDR